MAIGLGHPRPKILSVFGAPLPILLADNTACQICLWHLRPTLHLGIDFALECGKCSFIFQLKPRNFDNKQIDLVAVVGCRDRNARQKWSYFIILCLQSALARLMEVLSLVLIFVIQGGIDNHTVGEI